MTVLIDRLKAARRVSAPLIAIETADAAATIRTVVEGLNGGTPAVAWDVANGMLALNDAGQDAMQRVDTAQTEMSEFGCVRQAEALDAGCILFAHWDRKFWESPPTVQQVWNLRDKFKADMFLTVDGLRYPVTLDNGINVTNTSVGNTNVRCSTIYVITRILPGGPVVPATSDVAALGTSTLMWSDLFLASGGVINFNNGNYTLTHSAGVLTANGALATTGTFTIGATSGGTYSGHTVYTVNDRYPGVVWRAAAVDKALQVTDVELGRVFFDAPGGFIIRDTIFGGGFDLELKGGTIKFPPIANPDADANTLDDYEEGTFTPTIIGTGSAGSGTYSVQVGRYTKIGDRVCFEIELVWSAHTGTANMKVSGLPFTNGNRKSTVSLSYSTLTFAAALHGYVEASAATIALFTSATTGAQAALPIDTAATLRVSGSYSVN
jgi:hypothetical protein